MRGRVEAPLGGYMTLLIDSMLGPVFEKGLVQLKDHLENEKSRILNITRVVNFKPSHKQTLTKA